MRNLQRRFDRYYIGQIYGGDFTKICGLLKLYELYMMLILPPPTRQFLAGLSLRKAQQEAIYKILRGKDEND